jgi:hypothetical protein
MGKLKEEMGEDMETTLACDCLKTAYGLRCEYFDKLYTSFNQYLDYAIRLVTPFIPHRTNFFR